MNKFFYTKALEHAELFLCNRSKQPKKMFITNSCMFSHSAVMISYQNSSSQCMNFRRRCLVWKIICHLVSLQCKNHPVLEIQTQQCHESWTGLSRKSYFMLALQVFPQKHQLDVKIAVWSSWFYQIFREKSTIVIDVTNNVSNVA